MADSSGVTPPPSDSSSSSGSSSMDLPKQFQTGMSKPYRIKGDSAIRNWAKHFYPSMSGTQLDQFVQQFLMSICQLISQQISKEMAKAKKQMEKLKKAESGEE